MLENNVFAFKKVKGKEENQFLGVFSNKQVETINLHPLGTF